MPVPTQAERSARFGTQAAASGRRGKTVRRVAFLLLRRLVLAGFAFLAAAFSVSVIVHVLVALLGSDRPSFAMLFDAPRAKTLVGITVLTAAMTCVPAFLVGLYAEWRGIRTPAFFAFGGLFTAVLLLWLLGFLRPPGEPQFDPAVTWTLAFSGAVAGLVYWAIAGRWAGRSPR